MKIFKNIRKNDDFSPERNDSEIEALLSEVEDKLKKAASAPQEPDEHFIYSLWAKLLARRRLNDRLPMDKILSVLNTWFAPRRLAPVVAVLVIIGLAVNLLPYQGVLPPDFDPFREFSRLIVSPAYAMDNFTLEPEVIDSLGVAGDTSYILKSKEALDIKLIRESLRVEPEVEYILERISDKEWKISPKNPLPPNMIFKVSLKTSFYNTENRLESRDYSWAYQVKDSFRVLTHIPGDRSTGVPTNSGIEITFSHENFRDYERYITIEPKTAGHFTSNGRLAVFVADKGLAPATVYTVTVKAGLPLEGSLSKLEQDYVFRFETDTLNQFGRSEDYFNVYERFLEFGTKEKPVVQIYANNDDGKKVDVAVFKLAGRADYLQTLKKADQIPWWSYSRDNYQLDTSSLAKVASFSTEIKKGRYVQFVDFPSALPAGYYAVNFSFGQIKKQAWFQITNLSAYVNITKTDTIVWAHNNATNKPVSGAKVGILNSGQFYATNSKGVATFTTPEALKSKNDEAKPSYLEITASGAELILPATYTSRSYYYYESASDRDDYWSYLYTDRPKYQPTDTIKFWGLIKNRDRSPLKDKVTLILSKDGYIDYYYNPISIFEYKIEVDDLGSFSGEIKVDGVRPDYYNLSLKVGETYLTSKYVEIRPYVKPAYQISLTPDRTALFAGETVNLDVQVSFFEGTPVSGLPLVFKMPEGDYETMADDSGRARLTYTKKYADCQNVEYRCWPEVTYLRVEPKDPEMSEIGADASIYWYGPKVWAGVKTTYPEAGMAEMTVMAREIDLTKQQSSGDESGNKVAPNTRVSGEIIKITYKETQEGTYYDFISKKIFPSYRYERQEEKIGDFSGLTDSAGRYVLRQKVEPETSYSVRMKVADQSGRYDKYGAYLYYYDGSKVNNYDAYYSNYYTLEMPADKTYFLGEKVKADMSKNQASLPDNDGSEYLFLQLQNGLQEYQVSSNSLYTFTFEAADVPNVNLVGVWYKNGAYFTTGSGYFYSNRAVFKKEDRKLNIAITADKPVYEPGEDATLSVAVRDKNNVPVAAALNLNVVDEAYYAVAEDVADPLGELYYPLSDGSYYSRYSHKTLSDVTAAEKGGCFLAGTIILLADGSTKPIEEIKPGDKIKTFSDPLRLIKASGEVTKTFSHNVLEYLVINDVLRVTPEHLVYSNHSFKEAGLLKVGDWLLRSDGRKVAIKKIERKREPVMVYNFTVEPYHTYIADDFYVHNDKGGGVREYFTDAPLFQSVVTDSRGQAKVKFTLPDNITSWRVTAQAISNDLEVGTQTAPLKVTKGVFADVSVGSEYLAADKPVLRLRAFGTSLNKNDQANFTVKAPSLSFATDKPVIVSAFRSAWLPLPELKVGRHDITYSLVTTKGNDALKLPLNVVTSNLSIRKSESAPLTTDTRITSESGGPVYVLLGDRQRMELVEPLEDLSWSWGDRIDQLLSRKLARQTLNKILKEDEVLPKVESHLYQQYDGGIALLPYGQSDLELSARLAFVAASEFDEQSLRQYFLGVLNNKNSNREQVSLAITGLAALRTPLLPLFNSWRNRTDLSVKEKLYLGLAAHSLGADELARALYYQVMSAYAQTKAPEIIVKINDNNSETTQLTALAAALASGIGAPEREGLWIVAKNFHWDKYILIDIEKLIYIQSSLPRLRPEKSSVTYEIKGLPRTVDFEYQSVAAFEVMPADLASVRFTNIAGDIGITTISERPIAVQDIKTDSDIRLNREYFVKGQKTNSFKENDLVEIRLYPNFGAQALGGDYQIIDLLPSGLLPVTKLYGGYYNESCHAWYPYNIDGQKVKYHIWKGWQRSECAGYISYFARVRTKGTYQAEPAVLQSLVNPDYVNYSDSGSVDIK